jgi:ABC-type dipeptide/oligopeptide/nickel transport system ATPase component
VVECDEPQVIFHSPTHAFTRKLLAALPSIPKSSIADPGIAPTAIPLLTKVH